MHANSLRQIERYCQILYAFWNSYRSFGMLQFGIVFWLVLSNTLLSVIYYLWNYFGVDVDSSQFQKGQSSALLDFYLFNEMIILKVNEYNVCSAYFALLADPSDFACMKTSHLAILKQMSKMINVWKSLVYLRKLWQQLSRYLIMRWYYSKVCFWNRSHA